MVGYGCTFFDMEIVLSDKNWYIVWVGHMLQMHIIVLQLWSLLELLTFAYRCFLRSSHNPNR